MESPQNLKKRLKSVDNIGKITKAMELVSATKMRKAQEIALASRPYAFAALDLLANLTVLEDVKHEQLPELLRPRRTTKNVLFVLVASDKGLAGAFNGSVFKKFEAHMRRDADKYRGEKHFYAAVGEKAYQYLARKGLEVLKKYIQAGDYTNPEQVHPLTDFIMQGYLDKKWDSVVIISTHFRSALKQEPHVRRILPVDFEHIAETVRELVPEKGKFAELMKEHGINFVSKKEELKGYLIEPEPKKVLQRLAKHLLFMQMYHLVLEANASEHSARRMAMKTASDNATELGENLNLQYNKSRQQKITTEISEISAGAEALQ